MVGVKRTIPVDFAFDLARDRGARGRATDVERAHGQLGARLADRLGGDHADRFADVDQDAAAEVAAVALGAQAVARFAGERRAHPDLVDAEGFDVLHASSSSRVPAAKTISCVSGLSTSVA